MMLVIAGKGWSGAQAHQAPPQSGSALVFLYNIQGGGEKEVGMFFCI